MIVTIDPNAGFCYGVDRTIEIAEQELAKDGKLFCLGQIVHNEVEEQRLKRMGLVVIDHDEFKKLKNVKVLIRAHGEPPESYKIAVENNIQLVDASCPIVLSLQKKIRRAIDSFAENKTQIVIFGKKNHPEVVGLVGQAGNQAIVIENEADILKIDFSKPARMFSQTTRSPQKYQELIAKISEKFSSAMKEDKPVFVAENSVCKHVSNRDEKLRKFSTDNDVVVFVAGENSSNGRYLFGVCQQMNPKCWYIQSSEMLRSEWFLDADKAGVTGATSTPGWLLSDVANQIKYLTNQIQ